MTPRRHRRGGTFIEDLLALSVVFFALIIAAYVYMPDFQRGVWTVAHQIGEWWLGQA